MPCTSKGFTIVEVLIYVTLVIVAMVIMAKFVADVTVNAARSRVVKEVELNARITLERMAREVRNANSLSVDGSGNLVLIASDGASITMRRNSTSNTVERQDSVTTVTLTSPEVRVTALTFTEVGNGVTMAVTMAQSSTTVPGQYQHEAQLSTTVFPRQLIY